MSRPSSISLIPRSLAFLRTVATVVLVTFTIEALAPGARAIAQVASDPDADAVAQIQAEEKSNLGKALGKAKRQLRVMAAQRDALNRVPTAQERNASKEELRAWRRELSRLDSETRADFDDVSALIRSKNLPSVIRQRHAEAKARYESEMAALNADLDGALSATNDAVVKAKSEAALRRLNNKQLERAHQELDPAMLPNSALKPNLERKPKMTAADFADAGLSSNPAVRLAALPPFDYSGMPSAANAAYRTVTTEVVLTPDIVAKADELNGNPVEIYNWVRNNVQWQPTWGAIQDASHTLSSLRGNAFDISSLTIALLRASGIPARYVHGTIEIPEAKFRNWVGGFQNLDGAIDFASAGGIPITSVISGGKVTKVRVEHIWVEAAIDYAPSRGAVNKAADTWVAMDPSFKQIEVLPGLDIAQIAGVDPAQLSADYFASGTINEAEGWAAGLNANLFQNTGAQARAAVRNYMDTNLPNGTVGDVLGGMKIVAQDAPVLPAALPNRIVFTGARYASIPAALEQQISFSFGKDIEGSPIDPQTFPWAQLNNKQVTLSFRPATQADEDALRALLPVGGVTDVSQMPRSVPAYLIQVVPELKVDGNVVMSGPSVTLGTDVTFVFNPRFVSAGEKPFSYKLPAGSYLAVAVVAGSVSPKALDAARDHLTATKAALDSGNQSQITALTRERVIGDVFQTGVLGYYALYTSLGRAAGLKIGGHHQLAAGVGTFGYEPNVDYFFGVPRSLKPGGAALNIPIVNIVGRDAVGGAGRSDFTMQLGVVSSTLEHAVPEQLFASATNPGEAISAVKALSKATAAGQRIYEITAANQAAALPMIHHDAATMDEIRAALAAGKTVITHTDAVSVPGWSGAGYVLMDPDTGEAAWKIGGGANGGFEALGEALTTVMLGLGLFASVLPFFLILAVLLGPIIALAIGIILVWSIVLLEIQSLPEGPARAIIANLAWGAFGIAIGALTGSLWVALAAWILGAIGNALISQSTVRNPEGVYA